MDSPVLDQKERPSGTIVAASIGAKALQRALDYFYKCFPTEGIFTNVDVTFTKDQRFVTLPSDYLISLQDGIILREPGASTLERNIGRMSRRGFSALLSKSQQIRGVPSMYSIKGDGSIHVRPIPDKAYIGELFYYSLPAALIGTSIPPFPDDQVLVDLMEVWYKEWLGSLQKGSALAHAKALVATLQAAGFGSQLEPDQVEFDRHYFGEKSEGVNDWMGETTV